MSTYVIGDVQGCYQPLMRLLEKIHFNPSKDTLWFTGDLVNRGPHSLETLRFIKSLKNNAITVLGNHDLSLLATAREQKPFYPEQDTFADILVAKDKDSLLDWLEEQPLIHHDTHLGFTLVHAGFHPSWDLNTALLLAKEVQSVLRSPEKYHFYKNLYGNLPNIWHPNLTHWDRLRSITNCFTRIRFCSEEGILDFNIKESARHAPPGFLPWFKIPNRQNKNLKIVFGHWASLQGQTEEPNVFALDTGCVWGNSLTAMCLEDGQKQSEACCLPKDK